jgi:hypothetical protein
MSSKGRLVHQLPDPSIPSGRLVHQHLTPVTWGDACFPVPPGAH